jgi:hypothetical protein
MLGQPALVGQRAQEPRRHTEARFQLRRDAVMARARVSSHVMAGRSGDASTAAHTVVGPWPTIEMARTRALGPAAPSASETAVRMAAHQSVGSCSARPAAGVSTG